jgi:hypothetical protein
VKSNNCESVFAVEGVTHAGIVHVNVDPGFAPATEIVD